MIYQWALWFATESYQVSPTGPQEDLWRLYKAKAIYSQGVLEASVLFDDHPLYKINKTMCMGCGVAMVAWMLSNAA